MTIAEQTAIIEQLHTIKQLPIKSKLLAEAEEIDGKKAGYIIFCLGRFYGGGWGKIGKQEYNHNIDALISGSGWIIAYYDAAAGLASDLVITAYLSKNKTGSGSVTIEYLNKNAEIESAPAAASSE